MNSNCKCTGGEALSYQVLGQWASLGLDAAILPRSKITPAERQAYALLDKNGQELGLDFEAVWPAAASQAQHLQCFKMFLKKYRKDL